MFVSGRGGCDIATTTRIRPKSWSSEPRIWLDQGAADSEGEADLTHEGALQDVAEDVLLDGLVEEVGPLDRGRDLPAGPPHAEARARHGVGVGEAAEAGAQDVGPERLVRVIDGSASQEAVVVPVEAHVESVVGRQGDGVHGI